MGREVTVFVIVIVAGQVCRMVVVIIEVDVGGGRREVQGHEVSCLNRTVSQSIRHKVRNKSSTKSRFSDLNSMNKTGEGRFNSPVREPKSRILTAGSSRSPTSS